VDEPSIIDESIWILPSKCKTTLKRTVEKKTPPVFPGIVSQGPSMHAPVTGSSSPEAFAGDPASADVDPRSKKTMEDVGCPI
jgi:hypothetical protein